MSLFCFAIKGQSELRSHPLNIMSVFSYGATPATKFCLLQNETYYALIQNVLGQWHVTDQIIDKKRSDFTDVTPLFQLVNCHTECFWVHRDEYVVCASTQQQQQDETDNEPFIPATENGDEVVIDFHNAAKEFEKWKPKSQGEQRFKDTVKAIEMRATRQLRR